MSLQSLKNTGTFLDSLDYVSWKKNVTYNYSSFISHILEWPSLTCQFFPLIERSENSVLTKQKIIYGSQIPDKNHQSNFIHLAYLKMPDNQSKTLRESENPKKLIDEEMNKNKNFIQDYKKIHHDGPVLKQKIMYKSCNIIATKAKNGKIYIFDINSEKKDNQILTLLGHQLEGYALDWKMNKEEIISGSQDGSICIWDLNQNQKEGENNIPQLNPTQTFNFHNQQINDIQFHKQQTYLFCSVADHYISLWDQREGFKDPFFNVLGHTNEIQTLDFSNSDPFLLLTGCSSGKINLWDLRKMNKCLSTFNHGDEMVMKVEWNLKNPYIFTSSGADHKIKLWDLSKLNSNSSEVLFFVHSGHKGNINDFCQNPCADLQICSTDSKNQLQIWDPKESFLLENQ